MKKIQILNGCNLPDLLDQSGMWEEPNPASPNSQLPGNHRRGNRGHLQRPGEYPGDDRRLHRGYGCDDITHPHPRPDG